MVEPLQVWLWLTDFFIVIHALLLEVKGQLCAAALCQGQGQIKDQSKKGWLKKIC